MKSDGYRSIIANNEIIEEDSFCISLKSYDFITLFKPYYTSTISCFLIYLMILTTSLIIGGKGIPSIINLQSCSFTYWVIFLFCQLLCLFFSLVFYHQIKNNSRELVIQNFFDQKYKNTKLMKNLFFTSYFAGILAGTLGLGGGLVINPVLLKQGFLPEIAAGISGVVVLFTSLSTTS